MFSFYNLKENVSNFVLVYSKNSKRFNDYLNENPVKTHN